VKLEPHVDAHVAGLAPVVVQAVVTAAAIEHVQAQAAARRREWLAQVRVLELLQRDRRRC
jgi:hypothetical protein